MRMQNGAADLPCGDAMLEEVQSGTPWTVDARTHVPPPPGAGPPPEVGRPQASAASRIAAIAVVDLVSAAMTRDAVDVFPNNNPWRSTDVSACQTDNGLISSIGYIDCRGPYFSPYIPYRCDCCCAVRLSNAAIQIAFALN